MTDRPLRESSPRERFRRAGRAVMRDPADRQAHEERVRAAMALDGAEPLQGALSDLLHGCLPHPDRTRRLLGDPEITQRLAPFVRRGFAAQADSVRRAPRVSPLATRFSVLTMPSLDVPARAMLCGVDDSRDIAARAVRAMLAGDSAAEDEFLTHCEGAGDTLAFMLARRELSRATRELSSRWDDVASVLQKGVRS